MRIQEVDLVIIHADDDWGYEWSTFRAYFLVPSGLYFRDSQEGCGDTYLSPVGQDLDDYELFSREEFRELATDFWVDKLDSFKEVGALNG